MTDLNKWAEDYMDRLNSIVPPGATRTPKDEDRLLFEVARDSKDMVNELYQEALKHSKSSQEAMEKVLRWGIKHGAV